MNPESVQLKKKSGLLVLRYGDGSVHELTAEYLRVYSPSAEVRGHGKGNQVLQTGKRQVQMVGLESVGNYAVKLIFDDGHQSGIYSWEYLYQLATQKDSLWEQYLQRLRDARASRDPLPAGTQVITIEPLLSSKASGPASNP